MIVDTHCHLDLIEKEGISLAEILKSIQEKGVSSILQIATGLESSLYNCNLKNKTSQIKEAIQEAIQEATKETIQKAKDVEIYWTVGLHPEAVKNEKSFEELEEILQLALKHKNEKYFWGLGETGLDYFHQPDSELAELQKLSLIKHLELAEKLSLPIVLHTRDARVYDPNKTQAIQDALEIVSRYKNVKGVLHCFTYTHKEAQGFIDLGWFVSYSGIITFKNAETIREGLKHIPLNNLLVETDSPFLAPAPYRGQINQPSYVVETRKFLIDFRASLGLESPAQIEKALSQNSSRFLNLSSSNS